MTLPSTSSFRPKHGLLLAVLLGLAPSSWAQFDNYYGIPSQLKRSHTFGLSFGSGMLVSDVTPTLPSFNLGIYYQRRISRVVDIKVDVRAGRYYGEDLSPSRGFLLNRNLNGIADSTRYYDSTQRIYQNYQTDWISGTISLKINLNRLAIQSGAEKWDLYLLAGVGAFLYDTQMDAFNGETGDTYAFETITQDNTAATRAALQALRDGSYETSGEQDLLNNSQVGSFILNTTFIAGLGGRVSLTEAISLGLEATYQGLGDDLIDGQQWEEVDDNTVLQSPNRDNLLQISLMIDYSF